MSLRKEKVPNKIREIRENLRELTNIRREWNRLGPNDIDRDVFEEMYDKEREIADRLAEIGFRKPMHRPGWWEPFPIRKKEIQFFLKNRKQI
jgi:hypothetical protein